MNRKITPLLTLLFLGFFSSVKSQLCPSNIDFELGTYVNWQYYIATTLTSTSSVVWGAPSGPIAGRHTLTSGPGTDAFGFFPIVSPGGGSYSLKLGTTATGGLDDRATYTLTVPSTPGSIWSLIYRYAVVLENPGHSAAIQPKMVVTAYDNTTASTVPCTSYTYVSSSSVPGFSLSSVSSGGVYDVYYKPWTYGNMKFPGLAGHSVTVDFQAFDCGAGGHFGYGYIDMTCGLYANTVIGCASGTTVLSAPSGFQTYAWYDSLTFTTSYGSSQVVTITSPTITTTYAVILTPYAGYGCPDTLYTEVIPSTLFLTMSNDTAICSGNSVTLSAGATSTALPLTYVWSPSAGLSCTTCSNPIATPTITTTYSVTVTDAATCTKTAGVTVTVVPTPCAITGATTVCPLGTDVLSDCATGGSWTCGPLAVGTINPVSGVLYGVSTGTVTVVYTTGGICSTSETVTVAASPSPILPTAPNVCVGSQITVTDATPGGSWSVTPVGVYASIGSSSGTVTGLFAGTPSIITYTAPSGCIATRGVTVNPLPGGITGITTICLGSTGPLFDLTPGGTWSVTSTTVATVNPVSGVVYGASLGVDTVKYTLSTGCFVTTTVNVVPLPSPIVGPTSVCLGATGVTYTDATVGGAWSVSNATIAYVDVSGALTTYTTGVDTIYYFNGICSSSLVLTVNPLPGPVTGIPQVCVGGTTTLSVPQIVTWSSSDTTKATVNPGTGLITGISTGIVNITCTTTAGCILVTPIVVNPQPLPISGPTSLCVGTTITLTDATGGGTFSTLPGTWATVTPTGVVSGILVGTELITYTSLTTGCSRTLLITVNTTPAPITGVMQVCVGSCTPLSDGVPLGTWSCTPLTIGTISPSTGMFCGAAAGMDTVTYSLGLGCSTKSVVTVNALPPAILPASPNVCVGNTTGLTDPLGPGTWAASCPALTIGTGSGVVTGISSGTCVVTYTLTSTLCTITKTVTVNPNPVAILPPSANVCVGSTTTLSDGSGGGTWSTTTPSIGTISTPGGVVTGISGGTDLIKYTLPTGCFTTGSVTVNPLPGLFVVTGGGSLCAGATGVPVGLSGSTVGINYQLWMGGSPIGGIVPGSGAALPFGLQTLAGTYTVVATNPVTGCSRTMTGSAVVNVNPLPLPIVGPTAVCVASTMIESDGTPGGTWHSSNPLAATCTAGPSSTTTVTGVTTGLSTVISYTLPTSCYVTTTVNVSPSPGPPTGLSSVCVGACTPLFDAVGGGLWSSSSIGIATVGSSSGMVCGVAAGPVVITYSLGTGCTREDTMSVTAAPLPVTGVTSMCVGTCDTFHDATLGGSWLLDPGSAGLGTIGAGTGLFCGTAVGVATISYAAAGGTGCAVPYTVSVNAIPAPIVGSNQVCVGSCTPLTNTTPGGTWSITPGTYASVGATTGNLCGTAAGSPSTVKYTVAGCFASMPVTVNALPSVITGTSHVCQGSTVTLTSPGTGTGTWSSSSSLLATVTPGPSSSTVVTGGVTTGIATITYTLPTGCFRTTPVTVNLTPAPIAGAASICVGHSIGLTDATAGGTWSSSIPTIASVTPTTGIVSGVAPGCDTISYTVGSCSAKFPFCAVAPPSAMVGPSHICVGDTVTFTDPSSGGTWSSSIPGKATISPASGLVTGMSSGTVILSYVVGTGCAAPPFALIVDPISPILGTLVVCQGQTTHLIDTTLGGTWSSANPTIASVNPSTGVVTGVSSTGGSTTIRYTLTGTGCYATAVVTVNPAPSAITGPTQVCVGSSIGLGSTPTGGTWSSSAPLIGTIDPALGIVNGVSPGTTSITYTLTGSTGCSTSTIVTVNANPLPIIGPSNMCIGSTITLTDPSPGGTWSSSAPAIGSVAPATGVVYGAAVGSTTIMYTVLATSCNATKLVTVSNPPPAPTGTLSVCEGQVTTLSDAAGAGSWFSSNLSVATVDGVGDVTGGFISGTTTITFSLGAGCTSPGVVVTVNPLPGAIIGSTNLCVGSSETLTDFMTGGAWSSSVPAYGTIDPVTGYITGIAPGVTIITYVLPTGCSTSLAITISPAVAPIVGTNTICLGSTSTLTDASPGGTWSSSAPAIAPVSTGGVVSGSAIGTAIISYNTGAACVPTMVVTVNPLPLPITGSANICQGSSTTLGDPVFGGTWSSSSTGIATIGSSSGLVTAIVTGITVPIPVTITYMLGAGCDTTATILVNPVPSAITGPNNVCVGQAITLSDITPAGTWSSSSPAIGSVDGFGDVTGIGAGVINVSYSNTYSCSATFPVTVNASPTPITGSFNVCLNGTSTLHDALAGGRWFSSNTTIATVDSLSGVVTGVALGSATIIYTYHGSCFVSQLINVVPLPLAFNVTGGGNHCSSDTGVHIGLTGSTVGVNYFVYRGSTAVGTVAGTGTSMDLGLYTVAGVYKVTGTSTATGCTVNMIDSAVIGIIPSVTPSVTLGLSPGDTVCAGATVTLTPAPVNGGTPSYIWSVNSHPVALTGTYSYIPANGDTVMVAMTSSAVCATPTRVTSQVVLVVNPFAVPSVNLAVTPDDTVCKGTVVTVHALPTYGGTAPYYTWVKNNAPMLGSTGSFTFVPNDGDVVYVTMNSNYPCRMANADTSSILSIKVDTALYPLITINANPGVYVGPTQTDTFTATVTNAVSPTYQWYVNGAPILGATTNTFIRSGFSATTEDSVSVAVTSNGVCSMTAHEWVYIKVTSVGVQQITAALSDINVLPNPNKGEFTVKGSLGTINDEDVSMEVTDILGQVVYRTKVVAKNGKLNQQIKLSGNVANGMYMLSLHTDTENKVFHIVIEQ